MPTEKVVYILGAGFSAPLGLPVMDNFLEKSKDQYAVGSDQFNYFDTVFKHIDQKLSKTQTYYTSDMTNIEDILSILEMQAQLKKNSYGINFKKYISDVINYYTPTITNLSPHLGNSPHTNKFFGDSLIGGYGLFLLALLNLEIKYLETVGTTAELSIRNEIQTEYSLTTLNYDLVIEKLCTFLSTKYNKLFNHSFLKFNVNNGNDYLLNYAKLHGSIVNENIIAPTWNKIIANKDIKSIWKLAYKCISEANYIRILGYSLPIADSYIKYLLKSAVIFSPNLKKIDMICLDSNGIVEQRFNDFVKYKNKRFKSDKIENYFNQFMANKYDNFVDQQDRSKGKIYYTKLEDVHENFMNS